jgi:hypothetical protein
LLDRRFTLILAAVPVGLALGVAAWAAAGGPKMADERIAAVEAAAPRLRTGRAVVAPTGGDWAGAPSLFAATVVAEPQVRLLGVSRSTRRMAALVSIGGGAAVWLSVGETREGVTLESVSGGAITIDTAGGPRDVKLGEATAGSSAGSVGESSGGEALTSAGPMGPPQGRGPIPPASAPGMSGT